MLYNWRHAIQTKNKQLIRGDGGVYSLSHDDVDCLTNICRNLAVYDWPDDRDPAQSIEVSGIKKAVAFLQKRKFYGDTLADMGTQLVTRWNNGDFDPAPIVEEDLLDSSSEEEEDEADLQPQPQPTTIPGLAAHLLQGIDRFRNSRGNWTMKLAPDADKRSADVFGSNGIALGTYVLLLLIS